MAHDVQFGTQHHSSTGLLLRSVASRPYRWPYHGLLDPVRTALLMFSGDGETRVEDEVVARLRAVIDLLRQVGVTVIALPHATPALPLGVPAIAADLVMTRPHFGAFHGTNLDTVLRRRRLSDLLFAGFPFELGADCTMREANDRGYECLVLEDCCSVVAADTFAGALRTLEYSGGIFGAVAPAAAVLAGLINVDALPR